VLLALALLVVSLGCESSGMPGTWEGPAAPAPVKSEPWQYRQTKGLTLTTPHYVIHTTITDESFVQRLPQVMEGALQQYEKLAPGVPGSDKPMECFLFKQRWDWNALTRELTGENARTYLQINRGGYCIGDRYVAQYLGDAGTYSVSAHEGWHQFVSRHFRTRLPPFLEEGVATQFENIHWEDDLPRWNLKINANRAQRLRQSIDGNYLWPLEKLVSMHAGNVVGIAGEKMEAFYAQNWAFVRFALDAEDGKYRPALEKLLTDSANGKLYDPTGGTVPANQWRPESIKPILEHYFGMPLADLDKAYQAYVHVIAFQKFNQQWQAG
jgi:hypothetical protein